MPQVLVLDSWPILEWIKGREPVASAFRNLINASESGDVAFVMTRINYGEVLYSLQKPDATKFWERGLLDLRSLDVFQHSIDDGLVDAAVELKSKYSFSFADAFAAALAIRLDCPLVTGDREFRALEQSRHLQLQWLGS